MYHAKYLLYSRDTRSDRARRRAAFSGFNIDCVYRNLSATTLNTTKHSRRRQATYQPRPPRYRRRKMILTCFVLKDARRRRAGASITRPSLPARRNYDEIYIATLSHVEQQPPSAAGAFERTMPLIRQNDKQGGDA